MLRENEGEVPHLYLDSKGFVTAGVGHKFATCAAAAAVDGWVDRITRQPATLAQIQADWTGVNRAKPALAAARYAAWTKLDLAHDAIEQLLDRDIAEKETHLRLAFPGYDSYPALAQDALLDMAFNLGVNGLIMKFPHFRTAALQSDWSTCAAQCERSAPVSPERNALTRSLFEQAALVLA